MLDTGPLVDEITFFDAVDAFAFVLEFGPAVDDQNDLKATEMSVPLLDLVRIFASVGADHMRHIVTVGGLFDAEITVIEDIPETGRPGRIGSSAVAEFPIFRHGFLPSLPFQA